MTGRQHINRLIAAMMLMLFAPTAFASVAGVVLCLEIDGQTSFEQVNGENCANFPAAFSEYGTIAAQQHCIDCTDYVLTETVIRHKAVSAADDNKAPQTLVVAAPAQHVWPRRAVTLSLAPTPPPSRKSISLAHLRTVVIRV